MQSTLIFNLNIGISASLNIIAISVNTLLDRVIDSICHKMLVKFDVIFA